MTEEPGTPRLAHRRWDCRLCSRPSSGDACNYCGNPWEANLSLPPLPHHLPHHLPHDLPAAPERGRAPAPARPSAPPHTTRPRGRARPRAARVRAFVLALRPAPPDGGGETPP
ncbi:hypothetical protein GCM10023224_21020 [Streptomonospora halophila]|uniref:Uncharacterized protein n=1 Tax=Streptomonospora halophila TaxID=427369 RepID=A0ABP9GEM3_9ACTN